MTGCRDNSLGMDTKEVLDRFLKGYSNRFDVPNQCKKILQCAVFELDEDGKCTDAYKIKAYDDKKPEIVQKAYVEQ